MLNHCVLMGRIVAQPSYRISASGIPTATFSIACQRDFADKSTGEKAVDFIDCIAWRHTAEFVSKYMTKGRMAVVDGRLQLREWVGRDGVKRRSTEIAASNVHFGDSRPQNQAAPAEAYTSSDAPVSAYPGSSVAPAPAYSGSATPGNGWSEIDDDDSKLPF